MSTPANQDFLAAVIEGFYGPPWSQAERFELFDLMDKWGLNTYSGIIRPIWSLWRLQSAGLQSSKLA
jgi:hypothetical protein